MVNCLNAANRPRPDAHSTFCRETMKALHDLVQSGKVRYIGASSMWAWEFAMYQHAAERNGWTKFIAMQNSYSALVSSALSNCSFPQRRRSWRPR